LILERCFVYSVVRCLLQDMVYIHLSNFTNFHLLMDNNITVCYIYNKLLIVRRLSACFTYTHLARISLI